MKVLVLYSEIAGYFVACLKAFVEEYSAEVHVVRWPINPEAPFRFDNLPGITYHERKDYDDAGLLSLADKIGPDVVYIAGWIDKPYLKVGKKYRKMGVPVIAAFDTQWKGDWRQKFATAISPFYFMKCFTHAWVPGIWQFEYARRLGFPREKIETGMYSADSARFEAVYEEAMAKKSESFPKRFIYVGRYLALKGVLELYHAFRELCEEEKHDWTLDLIGAGPLREKLEETEQIRLRDFVQPDELPRLALDAGVFVLPSRRDAWAVVLHEFAATGMPLLSTDAAGATTALVKEGYNGWQFRAKDKDSLKAAFKKVIRKSPAELLEMGRRSHELSKQISPSTWAATLYKIATSG